MRKALLYHRFSGPVPAGDCYLPLSFAAEFQRHCDVTFASNGCLDLGKAARAFSIPLDMDRLAVVDLSRNLSAPFRSRFLASCLETRRLKRLARTFDICVCTSKIVDFGRPAHHFVCLLSILEGKAFFDHVANVKTRTGVRRFLRKCGTVFAENLVKPFFGIRPVRRIAADPAERIYPNSRYVEGLLRGYFGPSNGTVFYPPTTFEPEPRNVPRDPLKVAYIGRLDPAKRIPDIVAAVERARALSGKNLTLAIAGRLPPGPYSDSLLALAATRPWLSFAGPLYGTDKSDFLLSAAFACHAERDETFCISATEYLKAGIVPLVPDGGGAREVVDCPDLTFSTVDEAARILARLLSDPAFLDRQRRHCAERARLFSRKAYLERQHALLAGILGAPEAP